MLVYDGAQHCLICCCAGLASQCIVVRRRLVYGDALGTSEPTQKSVIAIDLDRCRCDTAAAECDREGRGDRDSDVTRVTHCMIFVPNKYATETA